MDKNDYVSLQKARCSTTNFMCDAENCDDCHVFDVPDKKREDEDEK